MQINEAFSELQRLIPFAPDSQKLPKIKTLRLATNYIEYLSGILSAADRCGVQQSSEYVPDFSRVVEAEVQAKNSYKERAEELIQVK